MQTEFKMEEDIIFDDNFKRMNNKNIHLYCTHALCHEGEASFLLAEKSFHMKQGDCIILDQRFVLLLSHCVLSIQAETEKFVFLCMNRATNIRRISLFIALCF